MHTTFPRTRPLPYIWVTWIAPLLAGELVCDWAVWFKAHFYYERLGDFDAMKWQAEHGSLVRETREFLEVDDFIVTGEMENKMSLKNSGIILAGQPDLVAVRSDETLVVDCKTGGPRASHRVQLLIYMVMLAYVRPELRDRPISGILQYKSDQVLVTAADADAAFHTQLRAAVHLVGGANIPIRRPSASECRFCNISKEDCPDRVGGLVPEATVAHDVF